MKPHVHIWLYFIIKAIKTEPCPYVYIWSGVTVMSGGGQRGTGDDYVLYVFYFILLWEGETEQRLCRGLLEELVRTEDGFEVMTGLILGCWRLPRKHSNAPNSSPDVFNKKIEDERFGRSWYETTNMFWPFKPKSSCCFCVFRAGETSVVSLWDQR